MNKPPPPPVGRVSPQGVTRSLAETNAYAAECKKQQPVGRVSPQGDTRSLAEANADVGLRCANPTYAAEWREIAFGDFIALQRGHDLPDQDRRPGNVPILGSFGVTGFHDTVKAKAPGVTVGRSGASFGVAAYTALDYWPLNTALYVTDFKGNDPKFVFYFLKLFDFSGYNSGSAQPSLNRNNLYGIPIQIPAPLIQKHIAEFVSALDDRIALLRETNVTLEAIAQALFKSWFVDFDPVHAKQQGRAPEGMDEATAALFPDSFEESALGLVPMGWRVGSVADLGEIICGKTPPTSQLENYGDDVPFITIPDMHNVLAVISTNRSLSRQGANLQRKKYLPSGSVCVSCIATPGLVVRVTVESQTNQQINSVLPFHYWGKAFPLFLLRGIGNAVRAGGSGGSVFHNLSKSGFEELKVSLTDETVAQKFDDMVEPLVYKIIQNQQQAQTLATLRDTLLPRLISGQLRLPEDAVV